MPKVSVFRGDEVLAAFVLGDKALTLGRGHESDIHVPDKRLSRTHCRLEVVDGAVVVTDLESTNGIFHKGERVRSAQLEPADEFVMGDVRVALEPEALKLGTTEFLVPGEEVLSGAPAGAAGAPREETAIVVGAPPRNLGEYARRFDRAAEDLARVFDDLSRSIGADPRHRELLARLRRLTVELEALTQG